MEEYFCDKCNGTGKIEITTVDFTVRLEKYEIPPKTIEKWCDKCNGTGKLNWLENVFGKEPEFIHFANLKHH